MSDLLEPIRVLLKAEMEGTLRGPELVARCTQAAISLQRAYSGEPEVPHEVWHYLSDADIRTRDPRYASAQLDRVSRLLHQGPE